MTIVRKLMFVLYFHRSLNARFLKFQAANVFTDWVIALSPQDHFFTYLRKPTTDNLSEVVVLLNLFQRKANDTLLIWLQFHENMLSETVYKRALKFRQNGNMLVSWGKGHNSVYENVSGLKISWCCSLTIIKTQFKNQFPDKSHRTRISNQSLTAVL